MAHPDAIRSLSWEHMMCDMEILAVYPDFPSAQLPYNPDSLNESERKECESSCQCRWRGGR